MDSIVTSLAWWNWSFDTQYAVSVIGAGVLFFCAWWAFCLITRNAIDAVRMVRSGKLKKISWKKIIIGGWK